MELAATEKVLPNLDFAKGETEPGQEPMQCFKWGVSEKEGEGTEIATQEGGKASGRCFVETVISYSSSSFRLKLLWIVLVLLVF